jgi:hypothetical protein
MIFGIASTPGLPELRDHFVAVCDEDARSLADLPDVGAQVVLQLLDADPLRSLHGGIVATGSYHVKATFSFTNSAPLNAPF